MNIEFLRSNLFGSSSMGKADKILNLTYNYIDRNEIKHLKERLKKLESCIICQRRQIAEKEKVVQEFRKTIIIPTSEFYEILEKILDEAKKY